MEKKSLSETTDLGYCEDEIEVVMMGLIQHCLCDEDDTCLEHRPEFYRDFFRKICFSDFAGRVVHRPSVTIHQFCELMEYADEDEYGSVSTCYARAKQRFFYELELNIAKLEKLIAPMDCSATGVNQD